MKTLAAWMLMCLSQLWPPVHASPPDPTPIFNAQWQLPSSALGRKPDAREVLRRASKAMGGDGLKTLRYTAKGTGILMGQSFEAGKPGPKIRFEAYTRLLDFENEAMREDQSRSRLESVGGGTLPALSASAQRSTGYVMRSEAWNMLGPIPVPAPFAAEERMHDLWTTPHGVLRAAMRNDVVLATRQQGDAITTTLSFAEPGRFTATVFLNAAYLVQQIDFRMSHPVLGDTDVVTRFSGYKAVAGVQFPARIVQTQRGMTVLDLEVGEVQPNVAQAIELPALVRGATDRVVPEQLADGVWLLAGGAHHSVLIEMKDHLILVECPLSEGRAKALFAEARRLVPGKNITQVISTHHHFDTAGGLRLAAAQGATLITSDWARPYLERTLGNPNGIGMDELAMSDKKPVFSSVKDRRVLSDGQRSVEVHEIAGNPHAKGMLMVVLPAEKLLIETDAYTPGPRGALPPVKPLESHVNLAKNIERLKLDIERIVPLHGRVVPLNELYLAIGRKP